MICTLATTGTGVDVATAVFVASGIGVLVGGSGVFVACSVGVLVGGKGVLVAAGVLVGGSAVGVGGMSAGDTVGIASMSESVAMKLAVTQAKSPESSLTSNHSLSAEVHTISKVSPCARPPILL